MPALDTFPAPDVAETLKVKEVTGVVELVKEDHAAVLAAVGDLRKLAKEGVKENAGAIANTIVAMRTAIKLHLAAEDRVLYPALLKSVDPQVAQRARQFRDEMGGVAAAYLDFARKWNTEGCVAGDPGGFRQHANEIFKALHLRIQRENQELYPLAALA